MLQHINFRSCSKRCAYKYMKPQSQTSRQFGSRRRHEMPGGLRLKHPPTDFHYQATGADFRVANDRLQRSTASFRDLSNEFLGVEMKRDYLIEAFCFLIIVSVSAWPIISMVRALSLLK
jgi:hypothetical protein